MSSMTDRIVRPSGGRLETQPNITPLIDVLLVLLIIFLSALPLTQKGLDVSVPEVRQETDPAPPDRSIVLEYSAARTITINKQPVDLAGLETRLRDVFQDCRDKTLFVSGDASLRYRDIIEVIDAAHGAGVVRLGVITESMRMNRR